MSSPLFSAHNVRSLVLARRPLLNNIQWQQSMRSDELKYEETMRIFPMTLRVTRYERPPPPPPISSTGSGVTEDDPSKSLVYKLPIIHFEGEARISDRIVQATRLVSGTVRMIGDGTVRWSMVNIVNIFCPSVWCRLNVSFL
jgi:hypothetical protein